jgi:hypothetical protein
VTLGASSGPTQCTAYLSGHSTLVTFSSQSADVSAVCRSWITVNEREGQRWTKAVSGRGPRPAGVRTACTLETRQGRLSVVVEDLPGEIFGRAACAGLLSAGWTERQAR